jgi:CheY-like chemotaxis protein
VRLRQVLLNLVGNAVKFTERGEVVVTVAREPFLLGAAGADDDEDLGSEFLRFTVRDTGIGIPEDRLGAVFDPFVQADGSMSRRYGGTGLGLSISARLVELMGGRMSVESRVGVGSTFSFTLPLPAADPSAMPATAPEPESSASAPRPVAPAPPPPAPALRILVAEDNLVNQALVRGLLLRQGHTVTVVANGREAVEANERESFDVVLMDVSMPEMDGLEATALIRRREATRGGRVPIVAMTAHAMKGDRERCLESGMDAYLAKPLSAAELWETLAQLAEARKLGASPPAG